MFNNCTFLCSRAVEDKYLYAEGGTMIRWSKSHDHLIATLGLPNAHLKIISTRNKQVLYVMLLFE